jgi:hypothetical protein
MWRDCAPLCMYDILKRPVTFCTTQHSLKSGIACIYQFNTKYFTAYVSIFFCILHYDLAHVFDFHLFSSKTSHSILYSPVSKEVTSFLYDILLSFSYKLVCHRRDHVQGWSQVFKVIAHCEALTAIFPPRSSIHGGTDGRMFCKQLLISRALLWQKHRDEEQGINMSRLLYLWQFYKGLLRRKILWVCEEVSVFLLELPCSRHNKVTRGRNSCSMCQQNFRLQ